MKILNPKLLVTVGLMLAAMALLTSPVKAQEGEKQEVKTGTDPRDFAPKFMPYHRYTELENGIKVNALTLFGLHAFSKTFAMTYEMPLAYEVDVSDTDLKQGGSCIGALAIPSTPRTAEGDCEETGIGDMNLRFMWAMRDWDMLGGDWLLAFQVDLPTATDPLLGGDQLKVGPALIYVDDITAWPAPGAFFALMNFYFTDVYGEDDEDDVSFYLGRWFFMLPLSKPDGSFWGGWYALPEFQPMYDFENSHFSFWLGPEFGKMLSPGNILYLKPGWGVCPDDDEGDRDTTFEIGYRYFMD